MIFVSGMHFWKCFDTFVLVRNRNVILDEHMEALGFGTKTTMSNPSTSASILMSPTVKVVVGTYRMLN